ncbi:MAG TPA: hypothetical protein VGF94_13865 [Kofleriaceae bacterium]|jgi:hypothetical protein
MPYGIPIRLSAALATSARETAEVQDRSLTEQVEHWARLGQVVESVVLGPTVGRLKAISHDVRLPRMLDVADTETGRARAARAIARANPVRYGTTRASGGKVVKVSARGRR